MSPVTRAAASETIAYTYDGRGRLVLVSHSGTINNSLTSSYTYDRADNRSNVTVSNTIPPQLSISDAAVTEGGTLTFIVTRSGATATPVSVNYSSANATALAGSDYAAVSGTLTFAPNETTKPISVTTIDDTAVESAETFYVNLSSPTAGAFLSDSQGVGTINDNDVAPPPSFSISDASAVEGDDLVFTVTKTGSTSSTYTVNYSTANGTATTADYSAASGTLTFAPAETTKTVFVNATPDALTEPTETFYVNLSAPSGGSTLSDAQGVGSISDPPPPDPGGTCYDRRGFPIVCP